MDIWYSQMDTDNVKTSIRIDKQLFSEHSDYQRIDVFQSKEFGKMIALDGEIIFSEADEFIYNEMGTDFKMHPKRKDPYVVNPYQIVANNGKFYLIANYDKYDNVVHFRIDKMKEIKCLNESIKPRSEVPELANGLNLPKHMAEHIYMFSGESVWAEIKTTPDMMGELVDWFGKDFKIEQEEDGYIIIRVKCNGNALRYWALQYGPYVEILKPVKLREQLKQDAESMYRKYSDQ